MGPHGRGTEGAGETNSSFRLEFDPALGHQWEMSLQGYCNLVLVALSCTVMVLVPSGQLGVWSSANVDNLQSF